MMFTQQSAGVPKEDTKVKKGKKGEDGKTGNKQQQQTKKRQQGRLSLVDIVSETPATTLSTTGVFLRCSVLFFSRL